MLLWFVSGRTCSKEGSIDCLRRSQLKKDLEEEYPILREPECCKVPEVGMNFTNPRNRKRRVIGDKGAQIPQGLAGHGQTVDFTLSAIEALGVLDRGESCSDLHLCRVTHP